MNFMRWLCCCLGGEAETTPILPQADTRQALIHGDFLNDGAAVYGSEEDSSVLAQTPPSSHFLVNEFFSEAEQRTLSSERTPTSRGSSRASSAVTTPASVVEEPQLQISDLFSEAELRTLSSEQTPPSKASSRASSSAVTPVSADRAARRNLERSFDGQTTSLRNVAF